MKTECQNCMEDSELLEKALEQPQQSNFDLFGTLADAMRPVSKKDMLIQAVNKMSEEECGRFWDNVINR